MLTGSLGMCVEPATAWESAEPLMPQPMAAEVEVPRDLVLVTHGWNGSAQGWPRTIQAAVGETLSSETAGTNVQVSLLQWNDRISPVHAEIQASSIRVVEVVALDWTDAADTFLPTSAASNAATIGRRYVNFLVESDYQHVHLIAHSAGSWMIDAMIEGIETNAPQTITQATFLDAFTPGNEAERFGQHADWAEHFVDDGVLFATNEYFDLAFNIDVSRFGPDTAEDSWSLGVAGHAWPHQYYLETAVTPGRSAYGFGRSLTMGAVIPELDRGAVVIIGRVGDSNDDGHFNTSDLIVVFSAGKFETNMSATHYEGDWNDDGFFTSSDLVAAFAAGRYQS